MALGSEVHPLFNPVILKKIFSFLQLHSLKNSRLTCKLWSRVAQPYLQKVSKVVLIRGGKADPGQYSFRNFLEFIAACTSESSEEPGQPPFENYFLDHWILNEKRERSLKQFWDICGPSIKHLHLSNVIFYEVETIRNIIYHWSPHLESLKLEDCLFYTITNENAFQDKVEDALKSEDFDEPNLSYDYYDHVTVEQLKNVEWDKTIEFKNSSLVELTYDQSEDEEFPLAWEEVFHAFPKIQKLNIALTTRATQISKIIAALHMIRQDSNEVGSLAELKFYRNDKPDTKLELSDDHLYKISDIFYFPLTSLYFVISDSIKVESCVNIVRHYGPLLQNLCLHSEHEGDAPLLELFKYQKFPNLEKLCVSMNALGGSFGLLEATPRLRKLHVWLREEEFSWDTPIDEVILRSLAMKHTTNPEMKELSIGYTLGSTSPKAITMLCSWFKNVRVLMMPLTDEVIRVVFKEMMNLEEITVFERHLTDVGITGNPNVLCESSTWKAGPQREFPYIGDLKKLWKFTLTFRRYENITDLSIYQGLMDVPELSSLLLTRTKIGNKALKDLSMKPTVITMVTPTICKGVELEYDEE